MTKLADYNNELVRPWRELVGRAGKLLDGVPQNGTVQEWNKWFEERDGWVKDAQALIGEG